MAEIKTEQKPATVDWVREFQRWARPFSGDSQWMVGSTPELGGGMMEFMTRQLTRNLDTMRAIAQCRDLPQIMELQQQWFRNTFNDYASETNRLITGCFGIKL